MKFKIYSIKWIELYKNEIKDKTKMIYRIIIEKYLNPFFGNIDLKKINYDYMQKYILIHKSILSNSTLNLHIVIIKSIMRSAYDNKIILSNESLKIRFLKRKDKMIEVFNSADQKRLEHYLISHCHESYCIGILLCLYTGVRIGELLALKWDDLDLKKGLLVINKSISIIKNEDGRLIEIVTTPKSESSNRIIPLGRNLIYYLKEHKMESKSEYVVSKKNYDRTSIRNYQFIFNRIQKNAKIENIVNFHALRHTFATRAIESGMDIKTLSEILGHKNASITLNLYVHSMFDTKKKAMDKLSFMIDTHCV